MHSVQSVVFVLITKTDVYCHCLITWFYSASLDSTKMVTKTCFIIAFKPNFTPPYQLVDTFSSPYLSRPALGPTMGTGAHARPVSGVDHQPHLPLRLRMSGAMPLLPLYAFMTCYRVDFKYFPYANG
jgi:hypothetical protein